MTSGSFKITSFIALVRLFFFKDNNNEGKREIPLTEFIHLGLSNAIKTLIKEVWLLFTISGESS